MATLKGLSQFKSRLTGGGARSNLFEVSLPSLPPGLRVGLQGDGAAFNNEVATTFQFLCKSAALPASNINPIEVPFRGRTLKVAGDRTVDPWTITVINDENFALRRLFESWMQNISQYSDHSGLTTPASYMTNATVKQLGRARVGRESGQGTGGNTQVLAEYEFVDIFPTSVSEIDLSYDSSDTIEEFTVEFQVQFWYPKRTNGRSIDRN